MAIGYRGDTQLFRKWSTGVPDTLAVSSAPDPADIEPDPASDELPIDEGMRWTVDYDRALAQGMAITVTNADLPRLQSLVAGMSRLVVLGVDWTLKPDQSATAASSLFGAHLYSDGLSFVTPGTATNNTGTVQAGMDDSAEPFVQKLDPALPAARDDRSASRLLTRALGLPRENVTFDQAPGAESKSRGQSPRSPMHSGAARSATI